MNGKILKIASNDLYGNTTDRTISVFAVFDHLKYMNKYIIFSYTDELDKKILYYGSVHLKDNALVIFEVNNNVLPYIKKFTEEYLNNKIDTKEYEIIDLKDIVKAEIISSSQEEYDHLIELDNISIPKPKINNEEESKKNKHGFLYTILTIMIILLIGATYIYFNPGLLEVKLKELNCSKNTYNEKLEMKYLKELDIKFNKKNEPIVLNGIDTYTFTNESLYLDFKTNEKQNEYFNTSGEYKYNDNLYQLKIFYNEETIINNYDELLSYLKAEGYTCQEGTYYE